MARLRRIKLAQLLGPKAGKRNGVCVSGLVPDVRPYLEQATVFVAPLRFRAGIQNKLLEAMAMGAPVVGSPLAADGLRTEEGEVPPLSVASTREEYAELVVQRLDETGKTGLRTSQGAPTWSSTSTGRGALPGLSG